MIIIDHREPDSLEDWFKKQHIDIQTQRMELEIGDYLIVVDDRVVPVERKTSDDFVGSLHSKHLNNQLYSLSFHYPESFLIITGRFDEIILEGGTTRKSLIGARVSAVTKRAESGACGRINIIPLEDDFDLPFCLYTLHKKIGDGDFTRSPIPIGKKEDKKAILSMICQCLPGVGLEKATKIAEKFTNLKSLVNATIEELEGVEGIGSKSAEKIYEVLNH